MLLSHRPVAEKDIQLICGFPKSDDELFFFFPKASFPLAASQLQDAIAQRSDSTVVELDGEVVAFANFYRWEAGGSCSIGNVIVSPRARGRGVGRYLVEQMTQLAFSKHLATEVRVSCFNGAGDFAGQTCRGGDQSCRVGAQQFFINAGLIIKSFEVGQCYQFY